MSFLKNLKAFFAAPASGDKRNLWMYAQCDKCGEILRGRMDLFNDLSLTEESDTRVYFCRKVLIGSQRCYRPIEIEVTFDKNRKLTDRQIKGGKFVDEEAYLAANADGG